MSTPQEDKNRRENQTGLTDKPFKDNEELLKLKSRLNHPAGKARK